MELHDEGEGLSQARAQACLFGHRRFQPRPFEPDVVFVHRQQDRRLVLEVLVEAGRSVACFAGDRIRVGRKVARPIEDPSGRVDQRFPRGCGVAGAGRAATARGGILSTIDFAHSGDISIIISDIKIIKGDFMSRLLGSAAYLAVTAAGILAVMLMIALEAGVTQQRFESVFALARYTEQFMAARQPLLLTLTFDNLFILAYTGAIGLAMAGLRSAENAWIAGLAAAGMVATGLLDYAENLHFLTMYAGLDAGVALTEGEVAQRMWASMMKWHIAYAAMFAASFVIPVRGLFSFVLVWSMRVGLPVIGVLVYTAPEDFRPLLGIARYVMMFSGFVLMALVFSGEAARMEPGLTTM